MTTTPTVWQSPFQSNANSTGTQSDPDVIGLTNGNMLVVWTDTNDTVASGAGNDVVGVIYDATLTTILFGPFQLNVGRNVDDENDASIAALNDGGFVVVYEDTDTNGTSIAYDRYDADGTRNATDSFGVIISDPGTQIVRDPQVAVNLATNEFFVSYEYVDGADSSIRGKLVEPNGTIGSEQILRTDDNAAGTNVPADGDPFDPDTAAMSNGNYLTVYREADDNGGASEYSIEVRVSDSTGTNAGLLQVSGAFDGTNDSDPQIAALTGGATDGAIVVWVENSDINGAILNTNGSTRVSEFAIATGADSQNEPAVIGLEDGGFVVVWDDDTDGRLEGRRFDNDGVAVGGQFIVSNNADGVGNSIVTPALGLTADGRVIITWRNGEIYSAIYDPREDTISVETGDGITTGRQDGSTINGTAVADVVYGVGGADTINGFAGDDQLFGGEGGDRLIGGPGGDQLNGGPGDDNLFFDEQDFATGSIDGGSGFDFLTNAHVGTPAPLLEIDISLFGAEGYWGGPGSEKIYTTNVAGSAIAVANGNGGADFLVGGVLDDFFYIDAEDLTSGSVTTGLGYDWLIADDTTSAPVTSLVLANHGAEAFWGADGNETVSAGAVASRALLYGNGGNDILIGSAFNDEIHGRSYLATDVKVGDDFDVLTGLGGADQFVFTTDWSHDTITDFEQGVDTVVMRSNGLTSFAQFVVVQDGADAIAFFGANNSIRFQNTNAGSVDSSDFLIFDTGATEIVPFEVAANVSAVDDGSTTELQTLSRSNMEMRADDADMFFGLSDHQDDLNILDVDASDWAWLA